MEQFFFGRKISIYVFIVVLVWLFVLMGMSVMKNQNKIAYSEADKKILLLISIIVLSDVASLIHFNGFELYSTKHIQRLGADMMSVKYKFLIFPLLLLYVLFVKRFVGKIYVLRSLLFSSIVSSAILYLKLIGLLPVAGYSIGNLQVYTNYAANYIRYSGGEIDPNFYFVSIVVGLISLLLLRGEMHKRTFLLFFLCLSFSLIFTYSRSGLLFYFLAIIISGIVAVVDKIKKSKDIFKVDVKIYFFLVIFCGIYLLYSKDISIFLIDGVHGLIEKTINENSEGNYGGGRLDQLISSIDYILSVPLLYKVIGSGYNVVLNMQLWEFLLYEYTGKYYYVYNDIHNTYLSVLVTVGVLGFAVLTMILKKYLACVYKEDIYAFVFSLALMLMAMTVNVTILFSFWFIVLFYDFDDKNKSCIING